MPAPAAGLTDLGQCGDPDDTDALSSLHGNFSGLQLVSLKYVGERMTNPSLEDGINLSREYTQTKKPTGLS